MSAATDDTVDQTTATLRERELSMEQLERAQQEHAHYGQKRNAVLTTFTRRE